MSQEYNSSSRKKHTTRTSRNRPVLVTSNGTEATDTVDAVDAAEATPASSMPVQDLSLTEYAAAPKPALSKRRFAGFLPTIGKSDQEETQEKKQVDVAQARIARATRNKTATSVPTPATKEGKATETKPAKPAASTSNTSKASPRPASPFKTRYIIGMALYLIAANFIGVFEAGILQQYKLDSVLTQFNLFGGNIVIRVSTLVFLATLVIILVLLARFDLIPRSFSSLSGGAAKTSGTSKSNTSTTGERQIPLSTREGVKGADDQLYRQYRSNQRRKK